MSVKRRDLIRYLESNDFYLLREGGNHSIYTNGEKTIPVKRHKVFNELHKITFVNNHDYLNNFKTENMIALFRFFHLCLH